MVAFGSLCLAYSSSYINKWQLVHILEIHINYLSSMSDTNPHFAITKGKDLHTKGVTEGIGN
jgi:hypothetical protein